MQWTREHEQLLWWLAAGSGVVFVATLIVVPLMVIRLPEDYFAHGRRHALPWAEAHPIVRVAAVVGKNLLGYVFVLVGLAMLLTPGQGLLTMVFGLMLVNFPGKYRLERWAVTRRPVRSAMNWLRRKAGKPPLIPWGAARD